MRTLIIAVLALWSVNLSAQSLSEQDRSDIQTRLGEYFDFTKANEYSKMMDYVYPKVFTIATKEQMVAVFETMEAVGVGMNVDVLSLNNIEPLMEGGEKKYAVADYDIEVRLELKSEVMQTPEAVESLKSSFKVSYNATDLNYDEETNILSFSGHKYLLAIKDPEFDGENWYFLEYDASNPMAAQMFLDDSVYAKFKEIMGL